MKRSKHRAVFRPRVPWTYPLSKEEQAWVLAKKREVEERWFWGQRTPPNGEWWSEINTVNTGPLTKVMFDDCFERLRRIGYDYGIVKVTGLTG